MRTVIMKSNLTGNLTESQKKLLFNLEIYYNTKNLSLNVIKYINIHFLVKC